MKQETYHQSLTDSDYVPKTLEYNVSKTHCTKTMCGAFLLKRYGGVVGKTVSSMPTTSIENSSSGSLLNTCRVHNDNPYCECGLLSALYMCVWCGVVCVCVCAVSYTHLDVYKRQYEVSLINNFFFRITLNWSIQSYCHNLPQISNCLACHR